MRRLQAFPGFLLTLFLSGGCIDINLPEEGLLTGGGPFVLKGEAERVSRTMVRVWCGAPMMAGRSFCSRIRASRVMTSTWSRRLACALAWN